MPSPRSSRSPARPRPVSPRASSIQQAPKASQPVTVHQLKITLRDIRPPIWRRVQVSSAASLAILHAVLQRIFAWSDSHLHEFEAGRSRFGPAQRDLGWGEEEGVQDERRVTLGRVAPRKGANLLYRYDFGDDWQHDIVVEDILPAHPTIHSPRCLDGRRAAPPDDCGGPFGYGELLDALAEPTRKDHAGRLEWLGDRFDPEAFDLAATNRALARIR
jgi:Plasmid pRiA4b ORF-3-like protein